MIRWFLSLLFLGMVLAGNAQEADNIDGDFLTQADLLESEFSSADNLVTIDQVGNNNEVEIIQEQSLLLDNQTKIRQQGDQNLAQVVTSGGNNQVILLQTGSENEFRLDLEGANNDIAVIQNGNQNEIRQRLSAARDLNIEFVQNGNGNLIEHQADGLVSKDIKVLQSGDNMEVIINQSAVALPPVRQ